MNNITTFDNFPPFATNGSRNMNTESAKYQVGFLEGETFPAEWANYLFHGATKGVSDLNTAVQSIWKENINVIQGSGQTPSSSDNTQLKTAIELMIQNAVLTANSQVLAQAKLDAQNAISTANAQVLAQAKLMIQNAISTANAQVLAQAKLDAHPVGSLYWSSDPTDPSILFGGTWVQIKNRFIWAKGDSDTVNVMGGSKTVTLTVHNLPTHKHYYTPNGSVERHSHGLNNHTHTFGGTTGEMSGDTGVWLNAQPNGYDNWHPYTVGRVSGTNKVKGHIDSGTSEDYQNGFYINLSHTHSFSGPTDGCNGNTTDAQPSFTGTRAQTEGTGSGSAVTVMNPFIVKFCWERIS